MGFPDAFNRNKQRTGNAFFVACGTELEKGRRHEKQDNTNRFPHRKNHQEGAYATRAHGRLVGEAGELHARKSVQGL